MPTICPQKVLVEVKTHLSYFTCGLSCFPVEKDKAVVNVVSTNNKMIAYAQKIGKQQVIIGFKRYIFNIRYVLNVQFFFRVIFRYIYFYQLGCIVYWNNRFAMSIKDTSSKTVEHQL